LSDNSKKRKVMHLCIIHTAENGTKLDASINADLYTHTLIPAANCEFQLDEYCLKRSTNPKEQTFSLYECIMNTPVAFDYLFRDWIIIHIC
jgi:hypothetical protein